MNRYLNKTITSILALFYPNLCQACATELVGNEHLFCISCWKDFSRTQFHLFHGNPLEQKMWGRIKIEHATAMYYFKKDSKIQEALHALKYRNQQEIGIEMGKRIAFEIEKCAWIKDIDILMPVPLTKMKFKKRGYNQSELIARGLHQVIPIPLDTTSLTRVKNSDTQTRKSREQRLENVEDAFIVQQHATHLEGKHILLMDDVVTSGSTLEACATSLLQIPNTKVSICTLTYAIQ